MRSRNEIAAALAPDAVVTVELRDVSVVDGPVTTLSRDLIELKGRQLPDPYELSSSIVLSMRTESTTPAPASVSAVPERSHPQYLRATDDPCGLFGGLTSALVSPKYSPVSPLDTSGSEMGSPKTGEDTAEASGSHMGVVVRFPGPVSWRSVPFFGARLGREKSHKPPLGAQGGALGAQRLTKS